MFLKHFGLTVIPFGMSPRLDFLFKSTAFEESMAHLAYGLDNSEAIILITGPIGSGKTMSLQSFLADLGGDYISALVTNTQVSTIELLKLIMEDLGVEVGPGWDKSDLLIAFKNFLVGARQAGQKVIVVIDEAQNLNTDVLEEVRLLTNLGQGMEQPVQLVLVGQPELKEIVERPELAQLRQRIRVHYEVETLGFQEMVGYVNHRMEVAGCAREAFDTEALKKLFEISGGIPRLVNTHAGDALLSAFVAQRFIVTAQDVLEGIRSTDAGLDSSPAAVEAAPVVEERPPFRQELAAPEPATAPIPIPVVAPVAPTPAATDSAPAQGSSPEYAHRPDRRRHGNGWRNFWITAAVLLIAGAAVWYTMIREDGPVANNRRLETRPVQPAVVAEETKDLPIQPEVTLKGATTVGTTEEVFVETETAAPVVETFGFYTHVASFQDSERAQACLDKFVKRDHAGRIDEEVVSGTAWYRVYIGPKATRVEAIATANSLLEAGEVTYYQIVRRPMENATYNSKP